MRQPTKIRARRPPSKINIGFRTYAIKASSEREKEATYFGLTDYANNRIEFSQHIGNDELKATLFHEYFHGFLYDNGLGTQLSVKKEEMWCQAFSQAVMNLIKDPVNWKIIEWAHRKESL